MAQYLMKMLAAVVATSLGLAVTTIVVLSVDISHRQTNGNEMEANNESYYNDSLRNAVTEQNMMYCSSPPALQNGDYHTDLSFNSTMTAVNVNVTCNKGYYLRGKSHAVCRRGEWTVPECLPYCKLTSSSSVAYHCIINKSLKERRCEEFERWGIAVRPECKKPNYHYTETLALMTCERGRWTYEPKCIPECGTITPQGAPQVAGGKRAMKGEFPWHAAVYDKTFEPYKLICGGSLVSNNVVISAAHCFYEHVKRPPGHFAVAVGKLYRGYYDKVDDQNDAQKSDVHDIVIPERFRGTATNYQHDIALVKLSKPVEFSVFVRPVCLNLDIDFERRQLVTGRKGKIAGWGVFDTSSTKGSPFLKVVELPFIPVGDCLDKAPESFKEYITGDKMCAGYENKSTAVCPGDSGGGLVFPSNERGVQRYFLRGIASTAPDSVKTCNDVSFAAFTLVSQHAIFIMENLNTYKNDSPRTCPTNLWQCGDGACIPSSLRCDGYDDCNDKSDEDPFSCRSSVIPQMTTTTSSSVKVCIMPNPPNHGSYSTLPMLGAPGQSFPSIVVNVTCRPGYEVQGNYTVFCIQGLWSGPIPICSRVCRLKKHPSVTYNCVVNDVTGGTRECLDFEYSGTLVRPECKTPNYYSPLVLPFMRCIEGFWDYVAECTPECGRMSPREGLVNRNNKSDSALMPWHATIYQKTPGDAHKQVCGGSLISTTVVISAAQCFTHNDMLNEPLPESDFTVAVGILYRSYNAKENDKVSQKSGVREIKVLNGMSVYRGTSADYHNIALLVVSKEFVYTTNVRPICLDFDRVFENRQLQSGNIGKVAAWGPTTDDKPQTLNVIETAYVSKRECITQSRADLVPTMMEADKMCVDYVDKSGVYICDKDAGSGLVFPEVERGTERYYLRGVVSIAHQGCYERTFIALTQVSFHEEVIKEYMRLRKSKYLDRQ